MAPTIIIIATFSIFTSFLLLLSFLSRSEPVSVSQSPIYGVEIPMDYREWNFIAPALESEPLNELRITVGNKIAVQAYRTGQLPFPDGAVLVKLAWKHLESSEFQAALIPGAATTVQVMVKDSTKFPATGGWGFGRFIDGKATDRAQHETCFACHEGLVQNHDYVFTRYAR